MRRLTLYVWVFITVVSDCVAQERRFTRLSSRQTGIDFNNLIRENDALNVLAYEYFYNGGGVAIGDINNDNLPDIFFTANLKQNKLYLNKGNFSFEDITKSSRTGGRNDWKTGVTMADVNADGWLDIYVSYSGKGTPRSRRNELYINNRDNTFTEKALAYGLADEGCSTQAIFFDYDLDDDLDCYVLNHNIRAYKNFELHHLKSEYDSLAADRLYRNDNGFFKDVSAASGISGNPISFGLGVSVSDINNDGWPDIYVSNDYTEQDYCYINNRNGSFSPREHYMFGHLSQFSMGSDIADINNDGLVDIFTLDMLPEDNRRQKLLQGQENYELYQGMATNGFHFQFMRNMLHLNNGNGTFSEIGQLAGISNTDWSWAPLFADFDNDGNKDLFVTNGYMRDYTNKDFLKYWGDYLVKQVVKRDSINYMDIIRMMPVTLLQNYIFRNNGDLQFKNLSQSWGFEDLVLSNGAAYGDLDSDGDMDLVVNNINDQAFVYRNDVVSDSNGHYLKIKFQGSGKNTFGLGAKIQCYTKLGVQFFEQMPTRGYQSSVSEVLHIGLGSLRVIDSLRITWPLGKEELLVNIAANQTIIVEQKNAQTISTRQLPRKKLFSYQRPFVEFSHLQLEYNDFKRQPLMPIMYSQCGPKFAVADLNRDGLDDLVIGASQGQAAGLYIQEKQNGLVNSSPASFLADTVSTTADVIVFDADNDNDLDVYLVSGGYADYTLGDSRLEDKLYLNNGNGDFSLAKGALPKMLTSKAVARYSDIDHDGDPDLFIGGRLVPGEYPRSPASYLLVNDGTGKFSDQTKKWFSTDTLGIITDCQWDDINRDGLNDLVVIGEWMIPTIYINKRDHFEKLNSGIEDLSGLWNCLELFDMDNDGDKDMLIGNWGLNSQLHASKNEPVELYWKDFDNNESLDPILCCYIQGTSYPYVSRDELLDHMYSMRRKFTSYKSFADAKLNDLFTASELSNAGKLTATHLATTLFENIDGTYKKRDLPLQAQFSPVYKIVLEDLDHDGDKDVILFGNNEYTRLKMGKMDANFGTVLVNDGKGNFRNCNYDQSGLLVVGDVKDAEMIDINGEKYLLVGSNNSEMMHFKWNK